MSLGGVLVVEGLFLGKTTFAQHLNFLPGQDNDFNISIPRFRVVSLLSKLLSLLSKDCTEEHSPIPWHGHELVD